jgi:hypothetical protein
MMTKMMNRIYTLVIALSLSWATGCQEHERMLYDTSQRYLEFVQFSNIISDTISSTVNLALYPGSEVFFPMKVALTGLPLESAFEYTVTPQEEGTTAVEGIDYRLCVNYFHAGKYTDSCYIVLIKNEGLKTTSKRLKIQLKTTSPLHNGKTNRTYFIIRLNYALTQPTWWNANVTDNILGPFSEFLYNLFLDHGGIVVLPSSPTVDYLRYHAFILKDWLAAQKAASSPVKDETGQEVTIPLKE